jgi:hypothetical protein
VKVQRIVPPFCTGVQEHCGFWTAAKTLLFLLLH